MVLLLRVLFGFALHPLLGAAETILQRRGLLRPPDPFAFTAGTFRTYDPRSPGSEGSNRLVPRPGAFATARRGCKRLSYTEILDTLREAMAPREKIAWIEKEGGSASQHPRRPASRSRERNEP